MMFISLKKRPTTGLIKTLGLALLLWGGIGSITLAQSAPKEITELIKRGSVLLLDETGKPLVSYRANEAYAPASVIKVLTAAVLIEELGPHYRPKTRFFINAQGDLGIQGFGDPYLVSEEIALVAKELKDLNMNQFKSVRLDSSMFQAPAKAPGTTNTLNPYDAINGALAVNFNSLFLKRNKDGQVVSAEKATPLTPLSAKKGLILKPGITDRLNLTQDPKEGLLYTGELFMAVFAREGLTLEGPISYGPLGVEFKEILTHENSRELPEILAGLLKFSNNYIANQMFLVLGAERSGWPAAEEKSLKVFGQSVAKKFAPKPGEFALVEASGIARENRVTANLLGQILVTFAPHYELLHPHKRYKNIYLKSGTLTGVHNYIGYIKTDRGLRPFVILLEQPRNARENLLAELLQLSQARP